MSRNEMKDWIVMSLSFGIIVLLFIITIGDFWIAIQDNRPPSKDVINLLSMAVTGIVGIIAGFISGKNAADQAKQQQEALGAQK
jgi:succinate dehydrogenase hydrophobic anchor subunit